MHEFSIMTQIVKSILGEVEKNNLIKVSRIVLEVGDLTFLGAEQLRFCFEVLAKDTILKDAEFIIRSIKPEIECSHCGFSGDLEYQESEEMHFRLPKFTCPKCNSKIEITKGRDCVLREITGEQ